jgi:ankyrin repeat protein
MNIDNSENECCCICSEEYNNEEHRPIPLHKAVNGIDHHICISCIFSLKYQKCPLCNHFIDYKSFTAVFLESCVPDQVNNEGNTALMMACFSELPLGEKCLPQQIDKDGYTALMLACLYELPEVALKLIEVFGEKCLPEQINKYGNNALMIACYKKLPEVALKLIEVFGEKCMPQQVNNYDYTSLIWACEPELPEVALKLIELLRKIEVREDISNPSKKAKL